VEAAAVLLWALTLLDSLPPCDTQTSYALLKCFPAESPCEFIDAAVLRPADAISRMRTLSELWHWRSRNKRLEDGRAQFPADEALLRCGIRSFDGLIRLIATKAHRDGMLETLIDEDFAAFGKAYRVLTSQERKSGQR
jgi:hypothetical protein